MQKNELDKRGNVLKEEIKRLDKEIKQEELFKQKEFLSLQNVLASKIMDKNKIPSFKNFQDVIEKPEYDEKTNLNTEPNLYKSEKNSNQNVIFIIFFSLKFFR